MPCSVDLIVQPSTIEAVLQSMGDLQVISRLTLIIVQDLEADHTKDLLHKFAAMKALTHCVIDIALPSSLDFTRVNESPAFLGCVEHLDLKRIGFADDEKFLQALLNGLKPSYLSLNGTTNDGAARLIDSVAEEAMQRLNGLTISCEGFDNLREPLMNAFKRLLQKPHRLHDVLIRTEEQLVSGDDASLMDLVEEKPPFRKITLQHSLGPGQWRSYFNFEFRVKDQPYAEKFFSHHLHFLPEIATRIYTIGALSVRDLQMLGCIDRAMLTTGQAAEFVRSLMLSQNNVRHLSEELVWDSTLPGGVYDEALELEIRRQLNRLSDSNAVAKFNAVVALARKARGGIDS
jgi:hypothetical protein